MRPARANSGLPRGSRSERFEARLTETQKALLVQAASLEDETITRFVVRSALRAAKRRLLEEETIKLSRKDSAALVDALTNPPAPSNELRAAFDRYRRGYVR